MKDKKTFLLFVIILFVKLSYSQNIWSKTSGPQGLDVAAFVITSDNVLVVSATYSGIYFSKDQGATWQKKSNGLNRADSYATSLAAGPNGILYAIIDQELYKLESNSSEWIKTNQKYTGTTLIYTNFEGWIFIVTGAYPISVLLSKDGGNTYKNILENKYVKYFETFTFNGNGNNYFIVEENNSYNVYRVNDDGSVILNVYNVISGFSRLLWNPDGDLFITDPTSDQFPTDGLFRLNGKDNKVTKITSLAPKINLIANNQDGNLIAFTRDGDYESINSGISWLKKNTELYKLIESDYWVGFNNLDVYALDFSCVKSKLSKSSDGGKNWVSFDNSFSNPYITDIFFDKSGNLFSLNCDNYKYAYSLDKGQHWQLLNLPLSYFYSSDLVSTLNGELIIKTYPEVYKSIDFGKSWNEYKIEGDSIYDRIIGDQGNIIFAFGERGNFISNDGGNKWKPIAKPPVSVRYLKFHPDGSIFLIGYSQSEIYISSNNGLSWEKCKTQFQSVRAFHISINGDIYISGTEQSFDSGLFVSSNKLETIEKLNDVIYTSLVLDKNTSLYAISGSCYKSIDKGKTWDKFSSGLPSNPFSSAIAIDENQYLFLGLNYDEVYKTIIPVSNSVTTQEAKSIENITIQPNPVNNMLEISISNRLVTSGMYRVIDLNGKERTTGKFNSNHFSINCSSLEDGMAFIQIIGENKSIYSEKFIVSKN